MPRHSIVSRGAWLGLFAAVSVIAVGSSFLVSVAAFLAVYLPLGGWKHWKLVYKTLPRDLRGGKLLKDVSSVLKRLKAEEKGVHDVFEETVSTNRNKVAIIFEGKEWTFQDLDQLSNRIGHYLRIAGFHPGDTIAIFMQNCPQYVALYLGMSKIGVVASLINHNLRSDSLVHCVKAACTTGLIFETRLGVAVEEVQESLNGMKLYCLDGEMERLTATNMEPALRTCCITKPEIGLKVNPKQVLFYVFTSGTTGLPKAAMVSHYRFIYFSLAVYIAQRLKPEDIIYSALPLYHTNAVVLGMGIMIQKGVTVVLRRKFSASHFWEDCCQYNCTAVQYIGELCRYLLAQPPRSFDTQHRVRLAFGNGMQMELWEKFQSRFQVSHIGEFYGATEGNVAAINSTGKVGACGHFSVIDPFDIYPVKIIKRDETTGQPIRDSNGLCVLCKPGECGEIIGKVKKHGVFQQFDGYANKEQTEKKLIYNVVQKGDVWFSSGDVMIQDEEGYIYFLDRTGDTFRWKGENVSTREVETIISDLLEMRDVVVFGVAIPRTEGKAGMAVIAANQVTDINLNELQHQLLKKLPAYTHPMFIRIVSSCDLTGTFKLKKVGLRAEGYNIHEVSDPLFYLDVRGSKQYEVLNEDSYQAILNGKIQF